MNPYKAFKEIRVFFREKRGSTTVKYHRLVECPDCGFQFIQDIESGCFHEHIEPISCPKCNYPYSIEKLPEQKKDYNPSERIKNV